MNMSSGGSIAIAGLVVAAAGCAPSYAYHFDLDAEPGVHAAAKPGDRDVFEDDAIKAELAITDAAILLDLTNKTDDVLQVQWNKIALDHGNGTKSSPRPAVDLGWIQPHTTASAQLVPVAFPQQGAAAAAYEGRHLELVVPVTIKSEPKTYRFHFVAHVHTL